MGSEPRYRRLTEFAKDFRRDEQAGAVSASAISRWENGHSAPPYAAIRRYEDLLTLRPGTITATEDTVVRYLTPPTNDLPTWQRKRCTPAGASLDNLVDRASSREIMSDEDWDRLTYLLSRNPVLLLVPSSLWQEVCARLLTEVSVADGVQWMTRAEAYHRLITHPTAQSVAIATAAAAAADIGTQSMIGDLAYFSACRHTSASDVVLRHIVNPFTDRTLYGSLLTSAKKLHFGQFNERQLNALLPALYDITSAGQDDVAILAARLLQMLPRDHRRALSKKTWNQITTMLEPAPAQLAHRISWRTIQESATYGDNPDDPYLDQFVYEMLFDPVFDMRLCAMFLVYATPYRLPLAHALDRELLAVRRNRGPAQWVSRILSSLRVLGGSQQRREIERLLLSPDASDATLESAAYALGHVGGRTSTQYWQRAIDSYNDRWQKNQDRYSASILDRLI